MDDSNRPDIRLQLEALEDAILSPYAARSAQSRGRERTETPCDLRPDFQRDRDRILHSKSFRRMKHKTQVFLSPEGDHYRTRLTHTLEVSQIARTIARALMLNESLTEAIALGHDLGHTPFGHAGERLLNSICPEGFHHAEQSVRVVQVLEKDGHGLNLTWEVIDGIRNHGTASMPSTLEGQVVRYSDKIAYINHDIDDAIRGHIITEDALPREYTEILGRNTHDRLNTLIRDVIRCSLDQPEVCMSETVESAMRGLRAYMFESVYTNPTAKGEEIKAQNLLKTLYGYYLEHTDEMPEEYRMLVHRGTPAWRAVCDYIAGMTDRYAVARFETLCIPTSWKVY